MGPRRYVEIHPRQGKGEDSMQREFPASEHVLRDAVSDGDIDRRGRIDGNTPEFESVLKPPCLPNKPTPGTAIDGEGAHSKPHAW